MNDTSLSFALAMALAIAIGFMYGAGVSMFFWQQDKRVFEINPPSKRFITFFGVPLAVTAISFILPPGTVETVLGKYFIYYSGLVSACLFYLIPASLSMLVVMIARVSYNRWLFSFVIFMFALLVDAWKVAEIIHFSGTK